MSIDDTTFLILVFSSLNEICPEDIGLFSKRFLTDLFCRNKRKMEKILQISIFTDTGFWEEYSTFFMKNVLRMVMFCVWTNMISLDQ